MVARGRDLAGVLMRPEPDYTYRATILRVVDGDTCHVEIDLGLDVRVRTTLRLAGINAPELPTDAGKAAKVFLDTLLASGEVLVRTVKDRREKYGRYLGTLYVYPAEGPALDANATMVSSGHAVAS